MLLGKMRRRRRPLYRARAFFLTPCRVSFFHAIEAARIVARPLGHAPSSKFSHDIDFTISLYECRDSIKCLKIATPVSSDMTPRQSDGRRRHHELARNG